MRWHHIANGAFYFKTQNYKINFTKIYFSLGLHFRNANLKEGSSKIDAFMALALKVLIFSLKIDKDLVANHFLTKRSRLHNNREKAH